MALLPTGVAAQDRLPSPLTCIRAETCRTAGDCTPLPGQPFTMRQADPQTTGGWVIQTNDRAGEVWVVLARSAPEALSTAPQGVRIAVIEAGITLTGEIILHEHWLHPGFLSDSFARHHCTPAAPS